MPTKTIIGYELDETASRALLELPAHLRLGIQRYIEECVATGGFLRAVFEGDLFQAVSTADVMSARGLIWVTRWIAEHAPAECFGSPAAVASWIARRKELLG